MTAPIRPFARSVFSTIIPIGKPSIDAPSQLLKEAGGRIYMDATPALLRFPLSRVLPVFLTNMDPAIGLRLAVVRDRPEFQAGRRRGAAASKTAIFGLFRVIMVGALRRLFTHDVARARADFNGAVDDLYRRYADALASVEPGAARLRIGQHEIARIFIEALMPIFPPIVAAGLISWKLVGRLVRGRVDPDRVQDLTRGFEGNATTEMDLELGDLADLARMVPALARSLEADEPRVAIARARQNPDAARFIAAWDAFLSRYGHRCPGEIDVTTPRWHEDPSSLVKSLVGMLHDDRPGEHRRRQEAARKAADEAAALIVEEAGRGLLGVVRRPLARALIRRVRTYLALREHGKYLMTRLFYLLREAALEAGDIAARRGLLRAPEDVWMLELDELIALLEGAGPRDASALVDARRQLLARQASLTPPPVITSDGEVPPLPHPDEPLPDGVLGGLGASAGTVEGVARVVLDPNREVLRAGEILVAPFTDPGWTPLFIHAAGLVMEVGGLMTHGSVVAREYGIPAVVGVTGATAAIATGQRIRVDGSRGRVTILSEETDKEEAA
ncbi:MAG: hypothetical protein KC636_03140 [Myxococcales bacterium]|nr:hypothetical protein [Myxococcales bacterium]